MPEIQRFTPITPSPAIASLAPLEARLLLYINDVGRVEATYEALATVLGASKNSVAKSAKVLAEKNIISLRHVAWDYSQKLLRMERLAPTLVGCVWDEESEWVALR